MKKLFKRVIIAVIVLFIVQILFFLFKNEHNYSYEVKKDDLLFSIEEHYYKGNYYFEISAGNNIYSFEYDNKFLKRKEVISDIEYYYLDDMLCIYPILDNNHYYEILCYDDGLYSYNYYKSDLDSFTNALENKGYLNESFYENNDTKKLGSIYIYDDNLEENTYIYLWKYDGFYTISNKKSEQLNLFSTDTYNNYLGIRVDKYYVIPNYDEEYKYDSLYIIDMTKNKVKELTFKNNITLSSFYYNNGVVDKKLYIFDPNALTQYIINPRVNKYKIAGNIKDGGLYYDGEWHNYSIYKFKDNELIFKEITPSFDFDYDEYIGTDGYNNYYLLNNEIICYNSILNTHIHLLKMNEISSIKYIDGDIYFISDDTLYLYSSFNLKKIVTYKELEFNKNNRYEVYKK